MLETDPYPHFVKDDALPEDERQMLLEEWPDSEYFSDEIPGNTVYWMQSVPAPQHWRTFLPERLEELARQAIRLFAPWIISRLGPEIGPVTQIASLMEAKPEYVGIQPHHHHYHSPNWIATVLVYLDDTPGDFEGTVVNRLHGNAVEVFLETCLWGEMACFSEHLIVDYAPRRMFAFADGPLSYHSSHKATGPRGKRRTLRFHLSTPWEICERIYGVTERDYVAAHPIRETATDPRVAQWAERDVVLMRNPVHISAEEAAIWEKKIEILPLLAE